MEGLLNRPYGIDFRLKPTLRETYVLKRSWKERLFTRPWKPLEKTRLWTDEAAVEHNQTAHRLGNTIYLTEEMYAEVKKDLRARQS